MEKKHYLGIRFRIILCTALCVVVVGLASNLFLYQYMQRIITEKVTQIDDLNADTIAAQLDDCLEQVLTLESYCCCSSPVVSALSFPDPDASAAVRAALTAQSTVNAYLRTSPIDQYITKLMIFNPGGTHINAVTIYDGTLQDYTDVWTSQQFLDWQEGRFAPFARLYPSLNPRGADCFALISRVYSYTSNHPVGYVYIELDPRLITNILAPYNGLNLFFVQTLSGDRIATTNALPLIDQLKDVRQGMVFDEGGTLYSVKNHPLRTGGLQLSSCINQTQLQANNHDILFSVVIVSCMILLIAIFIMVLLTHYITDPIGRIMEKINRISLNDYSFDPELEQAHSEMGEIGARLNELGLGFQQLLTETIALHDERTRIEMDLLQSQVNPHFLYNTLNSVHYMAVTQKNTGIEKMVRSLVSLLKNISKGVSDKIPLAEELSLLDDYINIQSIRYMGAFEYVCSVPQALREYKIIKFTLQPLVENAIFHGIVPKGAFGVVTVDAFEEDDFLVLTITDDGVGMTEEAAAALLQPKQKSSSSSMVGIGLDNVNRRLRLTYGRGAGLTVESVLGEYTKISVRISKER